MNRIARKATVTVAAVAAAGGLLLSTTGCARVCHGGWTVNGNRGGCIVKK